MQQKQQLCIKHKKEALAYCLKQNCNGYLCLHCLCSHSDHPIIDLTYLNYLTSLQQVHPIEIEKYIHKFKKLKQSIIQLLEQIEDLFSKQMKYLMYFSQVYDDNLINLQYLIEEIKDEEVEQYRFKFDQQKLYMQSNYLITRLEMTLKVLQNKGNITSNNNEYNYHNHNNNEHINLQFNPNPELLQGHKNVVIAVAISNNSELIASGSDDSTIKLWNAEAKLINTLKGHEGEIITLEFSKNDKYLASGGCEDLSIRIWDLMAQEIHPFFMLNGHESYVTRLVFSSDSQILVSSSCDQTVRLWNMNNMLQFQEYHHFRQVDGVAISQILHWVASCDREGRIIIWNYGNYIDVANWQAHKHKCYQVQFSKDSSMLLSSSKDKSIKIWSIKNDKITQLHQLFGHTDGIYQVQFSSNQQFILSAGFDSKVILYEFKEDSVEILQEFYIEGKNQYCSQAALANNFSFIVSGGRDHNLRVWRRML